MICEMKCERWGGLRPTFHISFRIAISQQLSICDDTKLLGWLLVRMGCPVWQNPAKDWTQ
jgi:hypothetical protein